MEPQYLFCADPGAWIFWRRASGCTRYHPALASSPGNHGRQADHYAVKTRPLAGDRDIAGASLGLADQRLTKEPQVVSEFEDHLFDGELPKDIAQMFFRLHKGLSAVSEDLKGLKGSIDRATETQIQTTVRVVSLEESMSGMRDMTYSIESLKTRVKNLEEKNKESEKDKKAFRGVALGAIISLSILVGGGLIVAIMKAGLLG